MQAVPESKHRMRKHRALLEHREPALINLPVDLPDVPIISPLLTALVAGKNQQATPTSTNPSSSAPTLSQSTGGDSGQGTTSNEGSGPNGGNDPDSGNGNTSSGGGNGGSGSDSGGDDGSSSTPSSATSSDGSTGDASSDSSFSDSGAATPSSPASASSLSGSTVGFQSHSASGGASSPSSTQTSISPLSSDSFTGSSAAASPSGSDAVSSSIPGSSGTTSGTVLTVAVGDALVNVKDAPTSSSGSGFIQPSSAVDGTSVYGALTSSGSIPPTSTGGSSSASPTGGISTGVKVSTIVIALALCLLALILFLVRRRHRAKLSDRSSWWTARLNRDGAGIQWGGPGTASARSSFATSYDFATVVSSEKSIPPPVPPPMVEVRDTHTPGPTLQKCPPPLLLNLQHTSFRNSRTASVYSSDPHAQYLVICEDNDKLIPGLATPMSVRPFSPSESFAFPQPPNEQSPGGSWLYDKRASESTSRNFLDSPVNAFSEVPAPMPETPALDLEIIRRPFSPTLDDELAVATDDCVNVVKVFDDGWALVEKALSDVGEGTGRGIAVFSPPGLIPIDCLREAGEDLPSFLSLKRVSDYTVSANAH